MGVMLATVGLLLNKLADLEFELLSPLNMKFMRRMHLRFMRVPYGKHIHVGKEIMIRNRGALALGERCAIGSFARMWNYAPIDIGDDFLSAGGLTLNSGGHDPLTLEPMGGPIKIGNRVWCGVNVTILGGVTIGDDVVLGAGSVVVKDIPANCNEAGARFYGRIHRTFEKSGRLPTGHAVSRFGGRVRLLRPSGSECRDDSHASGP